jgi:aspartyl-tRNA synthetase
MLLRRGFASIQAVLEDPEVSRDCVKYAAKITPESVVDIYGVLTKQSTPIASATQQDVELRVRRIFVVSASANVLPFQLEDASRPETAEERAEREKAAEENKFHEKSGGVGMDTRLDNRWIDLRTPANHAIFRLQSAVCQYYRQYFNAQGFVEIHSPKIVPGVSEGGSEVFRLSYFGGKACLAQSPQLYKQMAVISDLYKVYEIGPVFRAENSNTHRHMTEFMGLDFEMEIKEHYHEVLRVLANLFVYIFDNLNKHHQAELKAVGKQHAFADLQYGRETLVLSFAEAIALLRKSGANVDDFKDLTTPQEKLLGRLVKAEYKTDFYIVDRYPLAIRPFYTMPCVDDARYSNSYDVFLRGEEITSGAQRVHDVELLRERATACGIPHSNIRKYLESFKYGAYPHGGAGIGLERTVMLFLGLPNIRQSSMFPRTPKRCEP